MLSDKMLFEEMNGLNRFAMKLCRNRADAEDLVQTTIEKALKNRDKFVEDTKAFSWLSKIMYNSFVTFYNRKVKYESQYDPEPILLSVSSHSTQDEQLMVKEVSKAIQLINPQHREILILICVQEMSYEEAAESLNIPLGTVRSRLSRARSALMDLMPDNDNHSVFRQGKLRIAA
ncbi:MAG: sigma-70 family RNA polymerase sigma factor [Alphaproteobacteria bacterium]|nr:sigma-70 family RNA polymerase sigma factor [Alphaproteobacteria bacterium]